MSDSDSLTPPPSSPQQQLPQPLYSQPAVSESQAARGGQAQGRGTRTASHDRGPSPVDQGRPEEGGTQKTAGGGHRSAGSTPGVSGATTPSPTPREEKQPVRRGDLDETLLRSPGSCATQDDPLESTDVQEPEPGQLHERLGAGSPGSADELDVATGEFDSWFYYRQLRWTVDEIGAATPYATPFAARATDYQLRTAWMDWVSHISGEESAQSLHERARVWVASHNQFVSEFIADAAEPHTIL